MTDVTLDITRRRLLGEAAAFAAATSTSLPFVEVAHASPPTMPFVHEITMAAPDVICVIVRDPEIIKGPLVKLNSPDNRSPGVYSDILNPYPDGDNRYWVSRATNGYHKYFDKRATNYFNRAAAGNPQQYSKIGGRSVLRVRRKSMPYDYGNSVSSGNGTARPVSMEHKLFLVLDGRLESGTYPITFPPGTGLGTVAFNFRPRATRCEAIRNNQVGFRPRDESKTAYLSLWLPGEAVEGAIDYDRTYGLSTFSIINELGAVQFIGKIVRRVGPTDVEPNCGVPNGIRYCSTTILPLTITNISKAESPLITYTGDGFVPVNGQVVCTRGVTMRDSRNHRTPLEGAFVVISNVDTNAKTFNITLAKDPATVPTDLSNVDTRNCTGFEPKAYLPGYGQIVYATHVANRAATYVFELDFSSWSDPPPGKYAVFIEGLGRGDWFEIDDSVWFRVAQKSAEGFIAQCQGFDASGPQFKYKRPGGAFVDGQNGQTIYMSSAPGLANSTWRGSFLGAGPTIDYGSSGQAPWITTRRIVGSKGGYSDAGDWCFCVVSHVSMVPGFLTTWETLPDKSRHVSFGFPKVSQTLDPVLYAGTETLPDLFHQAIWTADAIRQTQDSDGVVASARGVTLPPPGGPGHGDGDMGHFSMPSWATPMKAFWCAGDPASNFVYAAAAASIAFYLADQGFSNAAAVWNASARAAWTWAEAIHQDTSNKLRNDYFNGRLNFQANSRWSDADYTSLMNQIKALETQTRVFAAGWMFRMTGDHNTYGKIIQAIASNGVESWNGAGAAPYVLAGISRKPSNTDPATVRSLRDAFADYPFRILAGYMEQANISYKNCMRTNTRSIRTDTFTDIGSCIFAHAFTPNLRTKARLLKLMQNAFSFIHGANQTGKCLVTDQGARNTKCLLHKDAEFSGQQPPPGILSYAFDLMPFGTSFATNFGSDVFWSAIVENPTGQFEADYGTARVMEPYRKQIPWMEAWFEHPNAIYMNEFQTVPNILSLQVTALFLHSIDGNSQTTTSSPQYRFNLKTGN